MKVKQKTISLYVKPADKEVYDRLLIELQLLWYQQFKESPSNTELIMKAMEIAKHYLQDEVVFKSRLVKPTLARIGQ